MNKTMLVAVVVVALGGGCARHAAEAPNLYDNQWSKVGATEADFKLASHECDVEEHQRVALDKQEISQDQWNDRYLGVYGYGHPKEDRLQARTITRQYWVDCMTGHSWRIVARPAIARQRGSDGEVLDYDEMGIFGDTNSFKPPKP